MQDVPTTVIAYVFWHRPAPGVAAARYEKLLMAFHQTLAGDPPQGFLGSGVHRLPRVPWLPLQEGGGGREWEAYEDRYLLDGSAGLDALDRAAVTGARETAHAAVAALAGQGAGGLYRCRREGAGAEGRSDALWLSKPRGQPYPEFLAELDTIAAEGVAVWQRQMVLGPAPEFVLLGPPDVFRTRAVPSHWKALLLRREPIWPARGR